ncbi:DUF4235 domain-containing protein [Amycolatopsis sp. NPDC051372]|uniref:DUF4235 domain-containing protein n=1 Tax=unclassified Amycolatopsis TaxID=2618356 RepID=UPI0034493F4D
MSKTLYSQLNLVRSAPGGLAAGRVLTPVWQRIAGNNEARNATDKHRTWQELLIAGAVQGAILDAVTAAAARTGAVAFEKACVVWPGKN